MERRENTYRLGFYEGWISIFSNILLFGLKYWAGVVSGSVALIADAWHTLTDSISSFIVLVGFKIASKPADKNHPFGHGRAELISATLIGFILVIIGFNFLMESIERLKSKEIVDFGSIAIIVTAVSIVVKELMAQYALWASRKTKLKSLKADALHHRTDALSSVIILAGILLGEKLWWIDGALGIFVSATIFYTAFQISRESASMLLGEKPEKEVLDRIDEIAHEIYKGNLRLHHHHIHKYGNHMEMTFHIVLPQNIELKDARRITHLLFVRIKEELNIIATIHIDTNSNY